jgi:hypothetical protein
VDHPVLLPPGQQLYVGDHLPVSAAGEQFRAVDVAAGQQPVPQARGIVQIDTYVVGQRHRCTGGAEQTEKRPLHVRRAGARMRTIFGLLGDVEVRVDGRRVEAGHARQRCVLAVLLVEVNRVVSVPQLVDRVCGEQPPHRARETLYN